MTPVLDIRSLARAWDGKPALRDLSLTLQAGGMLGLIGPDGAGKTTAMRMSCGLLRPDGGEVRVLGLDVQRDGEQWSLVTADIGAAREPLQHLSANGLATIDLDLDEIFEAYVAGRKEVPA